MASKKKVIAEQSPLEKMSVFYSSPLWHYDIVITGELFNMMEAIYEGRIPNDSVTLEFLVFAGLVDSARVGEGFEEGHYRLTQSGEFTLFQLYYGFGLVPF